MRIDRLWISNFKNLRDFEIDFAESQLISVVVGRNGTGKSNLFEAIVIIFRDLDLRNRDIPFAYRLVYQIASSTVVVDADPSRSKNRYMITATDVKSGEERSLGYGQFTSAESLGVYRPRFVFAYYSGHSSRAESLFVRHKRKFYDDARKGVEKPLRPFFYAEMIHGQFALLTFFIKQGIDDTAVRDFMRTHLSITQLDSVLFVMRKPDWKSPEGNPLFWNARGTVEGILSRLYEVALAPIRLDVQVPLQFRKSAKREHLYLYLPDVQALHLLADNYSSQQEFFKALESMYLSDLISEVRIRFRLRGTDQTLIFDDLSEGEQQLLMALGLMRFTKEDEALFLLDEPDTHLNPAWSSLYLDFIGEIVGNQENSQVIISTHNPLTLASLSKDQVIVMARDEESDEVSSDAAEEDPRGMGVEGILTSDIFGLRSTLDRPTLSLLDEKRVLSAKEMGLSKADRARLAEINSELDELRFTITSPDPLYEPFVEAMALEEKEAGLQVPVLTDEQREARKQLAREVLRRIKGSKD